MDKVPVLPFLAVYLESLAVEGGNAGGGGLAVHSRQQHFCHQQQQQHPERIRILVRLVWDLALYHRQQHHRHQQQQQHPETHKNSSWRWDGS